MIISAIDIYTREDLIKACLENRFEVLKNHFSYK